MVPELVAGAEESGRRDDAEEASDVHDAVRAPGVLCAEHAVGADGMQGDIAHSEWCAIGVDEARELSQSVLDAGTVGFCILVLATNHLGLRDYERG